MRSESAPEIGPTAAMPSGMAVSARPETLDENPQASCRKNGIRYSVAPTAEKQMSMVTRFTEKGTLRKASSCTSGCAARRSTAMKTPKSTMPQVSIARIAGVTPCVMNVTAQNSSTIAGTMSTAPAPATSMPPRPPETASRGSVRSPTRKAARPMGTLMRKMDSHGNAVTSMPPTVGPNIMPSETNVETMPSARPRCSVGNASVTMPMLLAMALAAPMPCTARAQMSTGSVVESPQSSEPRVKSATPSWNRRTLPRASPRRPKMSTVAQHASR